jgi:alpha-glucosidase
MSQPWWKGTVGYEVYIRSFADSDGDGIGDIAGLRSKLDHLAWLGVDLIWITPWYPSPQADHGYDVADYRAIDPSYGTVADVDALVADAHERGLKVVADLVPNHSSDQHDWFRRSLAGEAPYDDYYVWRDPAPDGGPPNNWVSHFGGPAWTYREERGQYYMHLFLPEQPDLNWASEAVRREFDDLLAFWFDRGIDGFRIDVAHSLVEDPEFRDNPLVADPPEPGAHPGEVFEAYRHEHDLDQPGVEEIYQRWNRIAARYDAMLLGEVYLLEPERLTRYVTGDALHSSFAFAALKATWDAAEIRDALAAAVEHGHGALSWPLSSHDDPHAAERFGGGELGARRALAYLTLLAALPGVPFLYQGDELGLDDGKVGTFSDPITLRNEGALGRDGSRTPMPWGPGEHLGFTTGTPWLELGSNRSGEQTVTAQADDPDSHLHRTRELLVARRELDDLRGDLPVEWIGHGAIVAVRRGSTVVACNVGSEPARLSVTGEVRYCSVRDEAATDAEGVVVPADAAVIVAEA